MLNAVCLLSVKQDWIVSGVHRERRPGDTSNGQATGAMFRTKLKREIAETAKPREDFFASTYCQTV